MEHTFLFLKEMQRSIYRVFLDRERVGMGRNDDGENK